MSISTRNKLLCRKGHGVEPIALVRFEDFLDEEWARMTPYYDGIFISESGASYAYYDYFVYGTFPDIGRTVDLFRGGLTSISNVKLTLSNKNNFIKTLRGLDDYLQNSEVKIYVLLSAGGVNKLANAELRFDGYIEPDGLKWDGDKIQINLVSIEERDNINVLKEKITKKDWPRIDENNEGALMPIVGGDWRTHHANTNYPTYGRHNEIDCTSPTYCIDTENNRYVLSDHPIATALTDIMPTSHPDEPEKTIGSAFMFDNSFLYALYDGSAADYDGLTTIIIPSDVPTLQAFARPTKLIDEGDFIRDAKFLADDDKVVETGIDCKTHAHFRTTGKNLLYSFEDMNVIIDPNSTGIYLECIVSKVNRFDGTQPGYFIIKTDGSSYYLNDGRTGWIVEDGEPLRYRPRRHEVNWNGNGDEYYVFTPDNSNIRVYRSINLAEFWGAAFYVSYMVQRENYDGAWVETYPIPPVNIDALLNEAYSPDLEGDDTTGWERYMIDEERLRKWQFGVVSEHGLNIDSFYLRVSDVYYKGGFIPRPPKPMVFNGMIKANIFKGLRQQIRRKEAEEHQKWLDEKAEIESRNNRSPIHVMVDGYTVDNTQGGSCVTYPSDHLEYLLEYRAGLTSADWDDSGTFHLTRQRRVPSASDDDYKYQWMFHYFLDNQRRLFDLLRDMAFQMGAFIYNWNGKYYLQDCDWWDDYCATTHSPSDTARYEIDAEFDENDILDYQFKIQDEVYDSFVINYAYSSHEGKFMRQLRMTPFETNFYEEADSVFVNASAADIQYYNIDDFTRTALQATLNSVWSDFFYETDQDNLHPLTINADMIVDVGTARRLLISLIKRFCTIRPVLTFKTGMRGLELKKGSLIYVGHTDFASTDQTVYQVFSIVESPMTQRYKISALQVGNDS